MIGRSQSEDALCVSKIGSLSDHQDTLLLFKYSTKELALLKSIEIYFANPPPPGGVHPPHFPQQGTNDPVYHSITVTQAPQHHGHHSITARDSQVLQHHGHHSTTGPFIVSQLERLMGCFIVFAIKTHPPLGHWIWIIWIISMGYYVHCPHLRLNGSFQRQSQTLSKPGSYFQFGNPSFLLQKLMPLVQQLPCEMRS